MTESEKLLGKDFVAAVHAVAQHVSAWAHPHPAKVVGSIMRAHDVVMGAWQDAEGKHLGVIEGEDFLRSGDLDGRVIVIALAGRDAFETLRASVNPAWPQVEGAPDLSREGAGTC